VAAWLLVLVSLLERQGGDVPAFGVDPELALPDLHPLHGDEALARVILDNGLQRLVRKSSMQKSPTVRVILSGISRS